MAATNPVDRYPRSLTLRNGGAVNLRLMTGDDAAAIQEFARGLSPDDLLFLRTDITSEAGIDEWVRNLKSGNTVSVVATGAGGVLGYALVHRNPASWTRRVGEIRVNVGPSTRGTGLGGLLTRAIFETSRDLGLRKLTAQMTPDQTGARAMFEHLGFQPEALLADWVEDRNGRTRDLLMMSYDLDGFTDRAEA